jgi:hypothetical protein
MLAVVNTSEPWFTNPAQITRYLIEVEPRVGLYSLEST